MKILLLAAVAAFPMSHRGARTDLIEGMVCHMVGSDDAIGLDLWKCQDANYTCFYVPRTSVSCFERKKK